MLRISTTIVFTLYILTRSSKRLLAEAADCACNRGLSPVCHPTSGGYVSTSSDCATQCEGVSDAVECLFLRYYSWRRRCSCSMYLPDRWGGWCNIETGAIASRDEACSLCKKMQPDAYADCDNLPEGVRAGLAKDVRQPVDESCDATPTEYCSMAHGRKVADSLCEAFEKGHKHVMPCEVFAKAGSEPISEMYSDSCLFGDEAARHIGTVAGWAACKATMHKCGVFERADGAMVHTMCMPSDACVATALAIREQWPECETMLNGKDHASQCTPSQAHTFWEEAVTELCKPFGPADYPS